MSMAVKLLTLRLAAVRTTALFNDKSWAFLMKIILFMNLFDFEQLPFWRYLVDITDVNQ